jgi:hypothetical protein
MTLQARIAVGSLLAMMAGGSAFSQTAERVATHTAWSVFVASSPRECYIVSPPTESVAQRDGTRVTVNRGDIRLFVTFRPGDNVANEVSFTGGYPLSDGAPVRMEVGSETFTMSPGRGDAQEWAWTDPSEDARAVASMRRGANARITANSTRGNTTVDTCSLSGFTAAITDAEARCR